MAGKIEDLPWWKAAIARGHKSIRMDTLAVRVPEVTAEAVRKEAQSRGLAISSVVAEALYKARPDWPWTDER